MLAKRILFIMLIAGVSLGTFSCKSQKKLAKKEAAAAEARKIAKAKADLEMILADDGKISIDEKERILQTVKDLNIQDTEIQELIVQAEAKIRREREAQIAAERAERLRQEREDRLAKEREETSRPKGLSNYFDEISRAANTAEANQKIQEAMSLFANENVPVLIIISRSGGEVDYDRPTNIKNYLNYLKDQKRNINVIENVVYDNNGKIKELELIRK
ncbi:MAG: hypothetical protein ACFCUU_02895 [Cyclobacteriaceae bacterium]